MGAEMTDRYFDEGLQAWVTVCKPGRARNVLTMEGFRGATRSRWSHEKGGGEPVKAPVKGWTGPAKRKRNRNRNK